MKLTLTELNIFIFCLLNGFIINVCFSQNISFNNLNTKDSIQVVSLNKDKDNDILKTPFGTFNLRQTTGTVFRISGEELQQISGDNLFEALRGKVPGLRIIRGTNTPGTLGNYSLILNGGTPYVLIDGQPRGLQVDLREVEEVIILSDATFNTLMGTLGDNGLIYVVTKGGKPSKPQINVNYQTSINVPTRLPELLSASEYATVINRAVNNDGLPSIYSNEAIRAYTDGSDPIRYPNVDNHETYLNDFSISNFASLSIHGGKDDVAYSAFVGYSDWDGLEKINTIEGRDLIFRTKIRTKINDMIEANASVYGKFGENNRPVIAADQTFNWISTTPANAFPLKYDDNYIVSNQFQTNLLSELELGGERTDYSANMIFDLGLDLDFNKYVPGLKYTTYVSMRTNNEQSLQANSTPGLSTIEYVEDSNGADSLVVKRFTTENLALNTGRASSTIQRIFNYAGNFSYEKTFSNSILNLNLNHQLFYQPNRESTQPNQRNLTVNLNASYALKDKYIMFANLNSSTSNKFVGDNRTSLFPTLGLAWVATNEDFLKDSNAIDFLKFRTSYGQVGTEYTTAGLFFLDTWAGGLNNNTIYLGTGNTAQTNDFGYRVSQVGNSDVDWVVYNQFFAGMQLKMFNKLAVDFNYFNIGIEGQVLRTTNLFSDALGSDAFLPLVNYTNRRNTGFNTNVTYNDNIGDFKYYVSVNAGHNKIIGERIQEVQHLDTYRLQQGQPEDNIFGYISDGLFTADNIDQALPQFGDVQVGDIRYVDQNGDNVIDERDLRPIGNDTPRLNYGINLGFEYKDFNLDIVGYGVTGYDINLNGNSYYTHYGLGNYYSSVNNNLPNGNANPRLSSTLSINNYRNSDYWLLDGSYFRISNVEFGYKLPQTLLSKYAVQNVKLFLRGTNIALFSKMKDLDPEDITAGVFEYPMMGSFVLGASLDF